MRRFFIEILRGTARITGLLIPWQLSKVWAYFLNHVYSATQSRCFKKCGKNFFIEYKAHFYGTQNVIIGDDFACRCGLRIEAYDHFSGNDFSPEIIIKDRVKIGADCRISAINKIELGNDILMAGKIFITDHSHGNITSEDLLYVPPERPLFSKGPVIIENNVWIGEGVVILAGVTIGNHCIIGGNAVVTKSIPPYSIAGGNPARIIKQYDLEKQLWISYKE